MELPRLPSNFAKQRSFLRVSGCSGAGSLVTGDENLVYDRGIQTGVFAISGNTYSYPSQRERDIYMHIHICMYVYIYLSCKFFLLCPFFFT